jgi:hypothetical protein
MEHFLKLQLPSVALSAKITHHVQTWPVHSGSWNCLKVYIDTLLKVRRPGLTIRQENRKVNGVVNGQNASDSSDVKRDEICFGSCHLVLGGDRSTCRMSNGCLPLGKNNRMRLQDATGLQWSTLDYNGLQIIAASLLKLSPLSTV